MIKKKTTHPTREKESTKTVTPPRAHHRLPKAESPAHTTDGKANQKKAVKEPSKQPKRGRAVKASTGTVSVLMYKLQLGDCFLLSFPKDDGNLFHMLIDCGLIQGAEDPADHLKAVAEDIKKRTEGVLDLVLITHEHWDHLSGFTQARDVFEGITFRQLWLAWTENPADPLAAKLRSERHARGQAVDSLLAHIDKRQGVVDSLPLQMAKDLRAFAGSMSATNDGGKVGEAFDWVKQHAGAANTRFCLPGDLLGFAGVSGARVYVLGPPHDEALIHRSSPSTSHPETYLTEAEQQLRVALELGASDAASSLDMPFDSFYGVDLKEAADFPLFARYSDKTKEPWRLIDSDWLDMVGPLALQLDSDTNNTSLAIAIELLPSRKVLLFPGDAQVGNWESWQNLHTWTPPAGDQGMPIKTNVNDLFARTVLYKVGHHGSRNATLKENGLEKMVSKDLQALIPVVPEFAQTVKHWKMPWPHLLEGLIDGNTTRVFDATATDSVSGVNVDELSIEAVIVNKEH